MAAYYSPLICTVIGGGVDVSRASVLTSTLFILPPCGYLFAITAIARVLNPDLHPFRPFSFLNPPSHTPSPLPTWRTSTLMLWSCLNSMIVVS